MAANAGKKDIEFKTMTEGNPTKIIILFALPILLGSIFQQLYNIVDTIVVGQYISADALGAISATSSSTMFSLALILGATNSITIVMAQYVGAKKEDMIKKTMVNAVIITLVGSGLMIIMGLTISRPLMLLLKTPDSIIDMSVQYMTIIFVGGISQLTYNTSASILRALGNSRAPLVVLIFASILHIFLDLLFVVVFHMGVAGVATSTVISQIVSGGICLFYMFRKYPVLRFGMKDFRPDFALIGWILKIGIPMGIKSTFLSLGMMVITRVINGFGTSVVAAYGVGTRIEQLAEMSFSTLSNAFATYAGQNLGAKQFDRIKVGFRNTFFITAGLCVLSMVVVQLFTRNIVCLFVDSAEREIIDIAVTFLRIESACYIALGTIWHYHAALRGFGDVAVPMVSSFLELGSKILVSIFLSAVIGYTGIWFAAPVGWFLGIIPLAVRYHSGRWKKQAERVDRVEEEECA